MCSESFRNPCRTNDRHFVVCQKTFTSGKVKSLTYLEIGTYDQLVAHLEQELQHCGSEIHAKLPSPTMATTKTNQNQSQNSEQLHINCRYCGKLCHVIKECRKLIRKYQEIQNEKQNAESSTAKMNSPCSQCRRTDRTSQNQLTDTDDAKSKNSKNL